MPLGLHTQLCGGWDHVLPTPPPLRVALKQHLLGIPEITDGLTQKAKASQCSLGFVAPAPSISPTLILLGTEKSALTGTNSLHPGPSTELRALPERTPTYSKLSITSSKHLAASSASRSSHMLNGSAEQKGFLLGVSHPQLCSLT